MKIAILAAGDSHKYYPLFIDKPKCLYHLNGEIQLKRVINDAKKIVEEKDIIVVAGYKQKYIKKFIMNNYPQIDYKVNEKYLGPAILSFWKAVEDVEDDVVFMFGDESISLENISKIASSDKKLAIMCHDHFYYYSLGIIKLRRDALQYLKNNNYLKMSYMKKVYCFANEKKKYDGTFKLNSGVCIGYIMIDIIRRIGKIKKVENPVYSYHGSDIDFIHYIPEDEYIPDLDYFEQTDEYKTNLFLRIYSNCFSTPVKKVFNLPKRIVGYIGRRVCKNRNEHIN